MHCQTPLAGLVFAIAPLAAQDVGSPAPDVEWPRTWHFDGMPDKKLSELKGSVVLLEFWATYADSSRYRVKRRNDMHASLVDRGLVVIALTNEPEKDVTEYNEKYGVAHPVAIGPYPGYEVRLIPYAFLIDKEGKIAWRGRPDEVPKTQLDKLLMGARPASVRAGLGEVHTLRVGEQFGEAYALTKKLLDKGELSPAAQEQARGWNEAVEQHVAAALAEAAAAAEAEDVYAEWSQLEPLSRLYKGVPGADKAAARVEELMASKTNRQEVEAGQKYDEARRKEADYDFDGAHEIYTELGKRMRRTKAGRAARDREKELEKSGMLGYEHKCNYCRAAEKACPTHARK